MVTSPTSPSAAYTGPPSGAPGSTNPASTNRVSQGPETLAGVSRAGDPVRCNGALGGLTAPNDLREPSDGDQATFKLLAEEFEKLTSEEVALNYAMAAPVEPSAPLETLESLVSPHIDNAQSTSEVLRALTAELTPEEVALNENLVIPLGALAPIKVSSRKAPASVVKTPASPSDLARIVEDQTMEELRLMTRCDKLGPSRRLRDLNDTQVPADGLLVRKGEWA